MARIKYIKPKIKDITGYMVMSLNLDTQSYFVGDWDYKETRKVILKKPRYFVVELHLFNQTGNKAITEYKIKDKLSLWELSNQIFKYTKEVEQDYPDEKISYYKSYAVIKLNKEFY